MIEGNAIYTTAENETNESAITRNTEIFHDEVPDDTTLLDDRTSESNSFCWQNISVWGKQKEAQGLWRRTRYRNIQIVKQASGFVPRGSLLAIMGPSGSGKTTLLAAISRRLREGVQGDVYLNGRTINADQMLTLSGFVPQDDINLQSLTVFEHFKIMASLKMDRRVSDFERIRKILILMEEIGIRHLASSYLSDLSGGEKRKLSIAVQLLTDPLLLFCDEPTTGLDSANAAVVIRMLKKFASDGKIVICSIHQPAALIYELFDRVLLLASGGRVAYFGPVLEASSYFQKLGFICPPNYNIAEFLINNISLSDFDADERIDGICETYFKCAVKNELEEQIRLVRSDGSISKALHRKHSKDRIDTLTKYFSLKKPTLLTQSMVLVQRSCLNLRRDYTKVSVHILSLMFLASMNTTLFAGVTLCSENSIQNIRGALSTMAVSTFYESAYYQFNTLVSERHFVMREINNGLYRIEAYCIAKLFGKLAVSVCLSIAVVLIFTSVTKAFNHLSFWSLVLPIMMTSIVATAYGCMLSSAFNELNVLFVVATGYEIPSYLLSGITVNLRSLPFIFTYLRYVSLFYYFIEYVFVLEWKKAFDLHIRCDGSNANGPGAALQSLEQNGYDVQHYQKNIWILMSISFILFTITYGFLRKKSKERVAY